MDLPTTIFGLLTEISTTPPLSVTVEPGSVPTALATPNPILGSPSPTESSDTTQTDILATQWLPLWTALIGALAGIGGSALSQYLAGVNEITRRKEQDAREDKKDKGGRTKGDIRRNHPEPGRTGPGYQRLQTI